MKKVIIFKPKFTFKFSMEPDTVISEKIQEIENSGWEVISVTPVYGFLCLYVNQYQFLLESRV